MTHGTLSKGLYLRLLAIPLIWGIAFVWAKIAVEYLPFEVAAAVRYLFASVTLVFAACRLEGRLPWPTPRQWGPLLLLGMSGVCLYNLALFAALGRIQASRASMIIALSPALIAVGAALLHREALGRRRLLGLAAALLGALIVISHGQIASLSGIMNAGTGELLMLAAVTCWVAYTLLLRRFLGPEGSLRLSGLAATAWASILGTLMLVPAALWRAPSMHAMPPASAWACLALMGILGTALAFIWYTEGIRVIGATRTAIFTNLVPVFGVLSCILLLGESPDLSLGLGGTCVLAGIFLVQGRSTPVPKME